MAPSNSSPGGQGGDTSSSSSSQWPVGTRYFTQITDDDHSAWLWIVTLVSLAYVLSAFVVRFVVKYGVYGYDDWALLASTILAVGQYITVLAALSLGLGQSIPRLSHEQMHGIQKYAEAHVFLYLLAHCMSKISTALLTLRLFENGRTRRTSLVWGLVILSALYGVGTILAASVDCSTPSFHHPSDNSCDNRLLRWKIILALDVVSETLLVVIPLALVLHILINRSSKITVTAIFAFRLMDIVFAALNLHQVDVIRKSDDYGTAIVLPIIWTQAELLWSIMAASLPCLKSFVRPFDKVDEETWRSEQGYSSSRSGRSRGTKNVLDHEDEVPLEDLRTRADGRVVRASDFEHEMAFRPGEEAGGSTVTLGPHATRAPGPEEGRASQDRIFRASWQWSSP